MSCRDAAHQLAGWTCCLVEEEGDLPDTLLPMLNHGRETGTLLVLRY